MTSQLTREQIEVAVRRSFQERVLSKIEVSPHAEAVEIAVNILVNKTMREIAAQQSSNAGEQPKPGQSN